VIYAHIHPQIPWNIQIFINNFSHLLIRSLSAMAEDRLQRMEDKIDRMSQAIVAMARVEESEKQAIAKGQKIVFSERLFWMVLSGAVGLAFIYLR
jgi:hypothetical protein